jgi:peptidoglycan/LPS O-acetylase OafA/YrhL
MSEQAAVGAKVHGRHVAATAAIIPDIEVLRAVAILYVLYQHSEDLLPWVNVWGRFTYWGGVDLFFAISGFVIARSLIQQELTRAQPHERTWARFWSLAVPFWVRRAARLLPSAWLWILIVIAGALFFNRFGRFGALSKVCHDALAALLYFANFHWFACNANWGLGCDGKQQMGPYWSLSLEEQFYFLFPFFFFFLARRRALVFLSAGVLAQLVLPRPLDSFLWYIRTDALLLGVAIAYWQSSPSYRALQPRILHRGAVALLVSVPLIALIAIIPAPLRAIPYSTGLLALVCGALVLLASYDCGYIMPAGLLRRGLLWVGTRSYALYLIHEPVFAFSREFWLRVQAWGLVVDGGRALPLVTTALVLLLGLAEANHRLVELPLRERGRNIAAALARRLTRAADLGEGKPHATAA